MIPFRLFFFLCLLVYIKKLMGNPNSNHQQRGPVWMTLILFLLTCDFNFRRPLVVSSSDKLRLLSIRWVTLSIHVTVLNCWTLFMTKTCFKFYSRFIFRKTWREYGRQVCEHRCSNIKFCSNFVFPFGDNYNSIAARSIGNSNFEPWSNMYKLLESQVAGVWFEPFLQDGNRPCYSPVHSSTVYSRFS